MRRDRIYSFLAILIFATAFFLLFYRLGANYLTNWDEAWYAAIARMMARTGNFATPRWNGQPFWDKPPLYLWATGGVYRLFGESEFAARMISAVAGALTVALVWLLAKILFLHSLTQVLAPLVLTSTIGFLYRARTGNLDSLLTLGVTLTIWAYFLLITTQKTLWSGWLAIGVVATFLTKGLIAFFFPAMVVVWAVLSGRQKEWLPRQFFWGLLGAVAAVLLWFWFNLKLNSLAFISYFRAQQVEKIISSAGSRGSFSLDYIGFLRHGLKLWFLFAIPALIYAAARGLGKKEGILIFYVVAFVTALSFFANKSDWFLLPIYPAIAVITAWGLNEFMRILKKEMGETGSIPFAVYRSGISGFLLSGIIYYSGYCRR